MKVCTVVKKLEDDGWFLCRITGSHRHYKHPNRKELVTIPGKLSKDVPLGTLHNIFKKAGMN
jgi:predicted RNA binding protein YcfA (HicA-like mRNA interferase family)